VIGDKADPSGAEGEINLGERQGDEIASDGCLTKVKGLGVYATREFARGRRITPTERTKDKWSGAMSWFSPRKDTSIGGASNA